MHVMPASGVRVYGMASKCISRASVNQMLQVDLMRVGQLFWDAFKPRGREPYDVYIHMRGAYA